MENYWENESVDMGIGEKIKPWEKDYSNLYGKDWEVVKNASLMAKVGNIEVEDFFRVVSGFIKEVTQRSSGIMRSGIVNRILSNKDIGVVVSFNECQGMLVVGKQKINLRRFFKEDDEYAEVVKSLYRVGSGVSYCSIMVERVYIELGSMFVCEPISDSSLYDIVYCTSTFRSTIDGKYCIRVAYSGLEPGFCDISSDFMFGYGKIGFRSRSVWNCFHGNAEKLLNAVKEYNIHMGDCNYGAMLMLRGNSDGAEVVNSMSRVASVCASGSEVYVVDRDIKRIYPMLEAMDGLPSIHSVRWFRSSEWKSVKYGATNENSEIDLWIV